MQFDTSQPIWRQLHDEFVRLIVTGQWPAGDRLPSTRDLALDYRVNPNTVQRALAELDRSGLTRSERTSGRFVSTDTDTLHTLRSRSAADLTADFIAKLRGLNITKETAHTLIDTHWSPS